MLRVAWKRFSAGIIVILVALLVVSSAYAASPTPEDSQGDALQVFVAADLTPPPTSAVLLPEAFVVLQAGGLADHLMGTVFVFFPPVPCATTGTFVSGTLVTNPTNGMQTLTFTGRVPPDPCVRMGPEMVTITIGPLAYEPPDPCVLTLTLPSGATLTYSGETVRFIVVTTTTSTSSTTTTPS